MIETAMKDLGINIQFSFQVGPKEVAVAFIGSAISEVALRLPMRTPKSVI